MTISPKKAAANNIGTRASRVRARRIAASGMRGRGPVVTRLARTIAAVPRFIIFRHFQRDGLRDGTQKNFAFRFGRNRSGREIGAIGPARIEPPTAGRHRGDRQPMAARNAVVAESSAVQPTEPDSDGDKDLETVQVSQPDPDSPGPAANAGPYRFRDHGASVGRYLVLAELGQGSMGHVVRAYDPKLQREVALKQVRSSFLADEGAGLLVAEARAMAKLSHPNVVAVHDVETTEQHSVVLVMEYVPGGTLRQWLRERHHPWAEILPRFIAAGRGLEAAHAAGVFHRDFKPANVLVGDDDDMVKVTDFGIAKQRVDPGGDLLDLDERGLVHGTPRYMAPEQHRGETVTAAADQYAFCVALWEALCQQAPFRGPRLAVAKHTGPPVWLNPRIPDPIVEAVERGLAPQPERRWPSMAALLAALEQTLVRREPQRWRRVLAAGVTLGAVASWWMFAENPEEAACTGGSRELQEAWTPKRSAAIRAALVATNMPYADAAWSGTRDRLNTYAQDWARMHEQTCEATTIRGEQSQRVMELRMACLRRAKSSLRATVDVLVSAGPEVAQNVAHVVAALPPLSRCKDVEALQAETEPPLPAEQDAVDEAYAHLAEAHARWSAGLYPDASESLDHASESLIGVAYGPARVDLSLLEADVETSLGQFEAAETTLREGLALAFELRHWTGIQGATARLLFIVGLPLARPEEALRYREFATSEGIGDPLLQAMGWSNLAAVDDRQGRYAEAEADQRHALSLRKQILGRESEPVAASIDNLANTLRKQGRLQEAEKLQRESLQLWTNLVGPDHPSMANAMNNLAVILYERGDLQSAEAFLERALKIRRSTLGEDHPYVAATTSNLAALLASEGKHAQAETMYRDVLELQERLLGEDHPEVALARHNLANSLHARGRLAEAETEFRRAIATFELTLPADHPTVLTARQNLVGTVWARGRLDEAELESRGILEARQKILEPQHPELAHSHHVLGRLRFERGDIAGSIEQHRKALAILDQVSTPGAHDRLSVQLDLVRALLATPEVADALDAAESAWAQIKNEESTHPLRAAAAFLLARALHGSDTKASAQRVDGLGAQATEDARARGDTALADEIQAWLQSIR